jgi:hypothetical protein
MQATKTQTNQARWSASRVAVSETRVEDVNAGHLRDDRLHESRQKYRVTRVIKVNFRPAVYDRL